MCDVFTQPCGWAESFYSTRGVSAALDRARARRILIPVRTEDVSSDDIPPPFDCLHTELVSNGTAIEVALAKLGVLPMPRSLQLPADFADTRAVAVLPFDNLSSDPGEGYFVADQSLCHLLLGNYDEAILLADKAVRAQPGNVRARQRLVAALNLRGQSDKARAAAVELSRLQANLDVAYIDDTYPFLLPHERDLFLDAPRASGLLQT